MVFATKFDPIDQSQRRPADPAKRLSLQSSQPIYRLSKL